MDIFEASLKRKNLRRQPVEWESEEFKLGETDSGQYTRVQCSIPLLTPEFPNPVVFFSVSNKQYLFARTHPEDLRNMAAWLERTASDIDAQAETLSLKQKTMINTQMLIEKGGTFDDEATVKAAIAQMAGNFDMSLLQKAFGEGKLNVSLPELVRDSDLGPKTTKSSKKKPKPEDLAQKPD